MPFINQQICEAFAACIANFLWQAFVPFGLFLGCNYVARNRPVIRHWCGLCCLFVMLACMPITFVFFFEPSYLSHSSNVTNTSLNHAPTEYSAELGIQEPAWANIGGTKPFVHKSEIDSNNLDEVQLRRSYSTTLWYRSIHEGSVYLVGVYFAGTGILLTRLMIGGFVALHLRKYSRRITCNTMKRAVTKASASARLAAEPVVHWCEQIAIPTTIGLFRPIVLLPLHCATNFTVEQIEQILIHEFTHLKRWDHITNLFQQLVETFLFFHPLVWYVSRQIQIDRELCCDAAVIHSGYHPADYAEMLVKVAKISRRRERNVSCGVAFTGKISQLRYRIADLAGHGRNQRIWHHRPSFLAMGLLIAGLIFIGHEYAVAQKEATSNSESIQETEFLQNVRRLPFSIRSIRFTYTDGSDLEHTYLLQGEKWRVDSRVSANAIQKDRRYIETVFYDGNELHVGLVIPKGKRVLLTATNVDGLPPGLIVPMNPLLQTFSWLSPSRHNFAWHTALSDEVWNAAIEQMRFVKDEKIGHREAKAFKISYGRVVHTIWFSVADDGFPIKCQSIDLKSRSVKTWEVTELTRIAGNEFLPTTLMVKLDDMPAQQYRIVVGSINSVLNVAEDNFQGERSRYAAILDISDENFATNFRNATNDILPIGSHKDGTQYVDFAFGMGRQQGTKQVRADDTILESVTDWDVGKIQNVELGNNRGITDEGLRYLRPFENMKVLYLYRTGVKGPGLKHLIDMPKLTALSLEATDFADVGMESIGRMPQLTWLNLAGTKISDSGIVNLANLEALETLTLSDTSISDQSVAVLAHLKSLRILSLDGTRISSKGLELLKADLPSCEIHAGFHLGRQPSSELLFRVNDIPTADEINARFRKLGIDGAVEVDPNNMNSIVSLRAFGVTWSSEVFLQLLEFMPDLKVLNTRNTFIDDKLLLEMSLPNLEYIDLSGSLITDAGIKNIGRHSNLREIYLNGTTVSDKSVMHFESLPHLRSVNVNQNVFSLEGYHQLTDLLRAKAN